MPADRPDEILVEIPDDEELQPGDEIVQDYPWLSDNAIVKGAQWALIESRLKKSYPNFVIVNYENLPDYFRVRIKIIEPPPTEPQVQQASVTPAIIVVAICGVVSVLAIFVVGPAINYRVITETQELLKTPGGQALGVGIGALGIAALIGVAIFGVAKLK